MLNEQEGQVEPISLPVEESKIEENKLVPQEEVNRLIGKAHAKALEKGYQKAMDEFKAQQPQMQQTPAAMPQQVQTPQMSPEQIQAHINKAVEAHRVEQERQNYQQQADRSKAEMAQKLQAAKSKYPDFDEVMKNIDLDNNLHERILHGANAFDNGADVMYDLAKNPDKLSMLSMHLLTNPNNPHLPFNQMKSLSQSIKSNSSAQNVPQPPLPLTQAQPTPTGAGNGELGVLDYKKMFRS